MPPILETKFFKAIEKCMRWILIFTGLAIVLLVTYYVVTRYLLKTNFSGFEELCILIVVWMYFIGSANASREQSHITADMLELFVKKGKTFQIIVVVRRVFCVLVVAVMAYLAWDFMMFSATRGAATTILKIPMFCYHISLFIGITLMAVYDLCYLINDVQKLVRWDKTGTGEETK